MAELSFNNVKSVVEEIAKEQGVTNYSIDVKEESFTGDNFVSKIVRVQISENDREKRQLNLLIKLNNIKEKDRDYFPSEECFIREILAYEKVLPAISNYQQEHSLPESNRFKFAKFYKGAQNFLEEYIIMEDLSYCGYILYGKKKPLDYGHSKTVLQALASYHATSFAMENKDGVRFLNLIRDVVQENNYPDFVPQMALNLTKNIVPQIKCEKRRNAIKTFLKTSSSSLARTLDANLTAPYNVICHGDLWNNNMLFKYQGDKTDVIFLDYQFLRYASPATDVIYNIYLSTDKSFRDEHFAHLCDEYYKYLGKNLQYYGCDIRIVYPREVYDKHLVQIAPFGILFGLIAPILLLTKDGEEKKLDEVMNDDSEVNIVVTDQMIARLEGVADDIIKYGLTAE